MRFSQSARVTYFFITGLIFSEIAISIKLVLQVRAIRVLIVAEIAICRLRPLCLLNNNPQGEGLKI